MHAKQGYEQRVWGAQHCCSAGTIISWVLHLLSQSPVTQARMAPGLDAVGPLITRAHRHQPCVINTRKVMLA